MKRFLFCLGLLWMGASAHAVLELKRAMLQIDGRPSSLGPVMFETNSYLLPFGQAVSAISHGQASVVSQADRCAILVKGEVVASMPTGENVRPIAKVRGRDVALSDLPRWVELADRRRVLAIDIDVLAELMGVSADIEGRQLSLWTPEHWARRLGISDTASDGLNMRAIGRVPRFGVTPPAETMLVWVMPRDPALVQMYKFQGDAPAPLFGRDPFGRWESHPPASRQFVRPSPQGRPLQAEARHIGYRDGEWAEYAVILVPEPLGSESPIDVVNDPGRRIDDYLVFGVRQRVRALSVRFDLARVGADGKISEVADRASMDVGLLRDLNGLPPTLSRMPEGTPLAVISKLGAIPTQDMGGEVDMLEVRFGEDLALILERFKLTEAQFFRANPQFVPGYELQPGDLIYIPVRTVAPSVRLQALDRVCRMVRAEPIRQSSEPGSAPIMAALAVGTELEAEARIPGGPIRVKFLGRTGWLPSSAVSFVPDSTNHVKIPAAPRTLEQAIVRNALRFLGTPYKWGGASLTGGVDCSHFVEGVMRLVGARIPAPVSNQERLGRIVHFRPGYALQGTRRIGFTAPTPSWTSLRPGDRFIIQRDPLNGRTGSRHTGIYIGPYGRIRHAVVHASSRRGVVVDDIRRLGGAYRFSVRGPYGKSRRVR